MLEGLKPPQNKAVYCKIADIAETLEPKDKDIFLSAVDDATNWSANGLSTQLRHRGLSVADTTIAKHRSKACACFRDKLN